MNPLVVDADDFCQGNTGMEYLTALKQWIPNFKITLFTIPGLCDLLWLKFIRSHFDWIDLVPHGWKHDTPLETKLWTYEQMVAHLNTVEQIGVFAKGYKAPGWQITDGMYQALIERDYWVADQAYNNDRRPVGMKVYLLDQPGRHHHHVQNVCGNGLPESFQDLVKLQGDFQFIKDVV